MHLEAPLDGIWNTANNFIKMLDVVLTETKKGPRESVLLLGIAYVFFSIKYSKNPEDPDIIEDAKNFLDSIVHLMVILEEGEHD